MVEADKDRGEAGYEGRRRSAKSDGAGARLRKREQGTTARVLHPFLALLTRFSGRLVKDTCSLRHRNKVIVLSLRHYHLCYRISLRLAG